LQGWQQTRGKTIPALQQNIVELTAAVDDETRTGGLLAADPGLNALRTALFQKTSILACELASISFPLTPSDAAKLSAVLQLLEDEEHALTDFDRRLADLVDKAKPQKAQAQNKSGR
jgi:hypothetical protein